MTKGGIRPDTKVESNHLFKPKWNNKKTTAIRIPEVFKESFMALAKYLDTSEFIGDDFSKIHEKVINYKVLENNLKFYQEQTAKLKKKNKLVKEKLSEINNQDVQTNKQDDYQIAVRCFDEYIKSQNLNIDELSKSRKGTKKYQLYEIHNWLSKQVENIN